MKSREDGKPVGSPVTEEIQEKIRRPMNPYLENFLIGFFFCFLLLAAVGIACGAMALCLYIGKNFSEPAGFLTAGFMACVVFGSISAFNTTVND